MPKVNESQFDKTLDLLQATGLNWTVSKEPLLTADGKPTQSFGLFRSDTQKWLGTVKSRYVPMQNATLAETIVLATSGIGLKANRGGELRGGQRIYIQTELPEVHIGNSPVKRYITALNSHDGSTAIAFGSTNDVVMCDNTFHRVYSSGDLTRYRHTESAEERIEEAMKRLRQALTSEADMVDAFKRMANIPLTTEIHKKVREAVLVDGMGFDLDAKLSTRRTNTMDKLDAAIARELKDEGSTLWGLFNGFTRFTNHELVPKKGEKLDFVMGGGGYAINQVAYESLMEII
jgi:phage/plasmid-like protein (TIGR03299 family)